MWLARDSVGYWLFHSKPNLNEIGMWCLGANFGCVVADPPFLLRPGQRVKVDVKITRKAKRNHRKAR